MSKGDPARAFTALVLAGSRAPDDPLAREFGVAFKALVPIGGRSMLDRVIRTLQSCGGIGRIAVCAPPDPGIDRLCKAAGVERVTAATSPARSVQAAIEALGGPYPLLVATGDHPLLTADMVTFFLENAGDTQADIAVALASRTTIRAAYPDAVRTYLPFRDDGFSGCNLFALMTGRAAAAVRFWQRIEAERKRPWRLVRAFGLTPLFLFLARRLTLDRAMQIASRRLALEVRAVRMPYAEAAIDVDKAADKLLAERILMGGHQRPQPPSPGPLLRAGPPSPVKGEGQGEAY